MVFDPKLQGGVAFNQPVSQPNAMEAVAGLFNFGMSSLSASAGSAPKPTEDEKFAMAMREFESSKGGAFTWDRKGMREFIFKYPQFTSQAKAWGEGQAIVPKSGEETAIDSIQTWFSTPEGIVAVAQANTMPETDREAYLMQEAGRVKQQEAEIAKIDREIKLLEQQGTLDQKRWDALKPTSKAFADNVVETILDPILGEVMNGVTVEVSPEMKTQLGIRYDTISLNNINAVLQDTRQFLSNSFNQKYVDNFGNQVLPSADWEIQVLGNLDNMIELGKAFDTPQEQAAFTKALIDTEMYKKLDDNGLAITMRMIEVLPPDTANRLLGTIAGFDEKFAKVLAEDGQILDRKSIKIKVEEGSVSDANSVATDSIEFLDKGFIPEVFTAFNEAAKKAGYEAVDEASFKTIIGQHANDIVKLVASDSEARTEISDFINSDIQKTISLVKQNLPNNMQLTFVNGKATVTFKGGVSAQLAEDNEMRTISGLPTFTEQQILEEQLKSLPKGMNLDTINAKLATLGVLGPMGKEIQEAIGILNTEPTEVRPRQGDRAIPKGRGRGSVGGEVTKSSKGEAGDIGTKLGIDFATMESEAQLPSGYLNKVAMIESGGNPNAKNPNSSATGLFQQIDSNAAAYGVVDRTDPLQSTQGAVRFAVENKNYLTGVLGREPTGGELYLAHQQGPGGAAKLLSNPSAKAVDIVGLEAVRLNGGDANMSAGEFANIWISKYNGSRGEMTGSYAASGGSLRPSIDSAGVPIPESVRGSQGGSAGLSVGALTFESPEVQEVVAKSQTEPEAAIAMAKEILKKPMDPSIKSLIEALVKIGERA